MSETTQEERMRILVADDEESIRFVLRETLSSEGHHVDEVSSGESAAQQLAAGNYDLAFLDIRMPGMTGLEVLGQLRSSGCDTDVVIVTAQNTMDNAVDAMKKGALDYLTKPFSLDEVIALAERARTTRVLQREVQELRREVGATNTSNRERIVGSSPAMLEIFKVIGKVALRNVPILIQGESGTGKELVARAIHFSSPRADSPFVAVNAAAIPSELLESELFGHERGAFTGAVSARLGRFREASGGTLFLDEIGDMPIELQAKLLRVVQNGEVIPVGGRDPIQVDVRILAATHHDLDESVKQGQFREDLLYRLRVIPIGIPALRKRPEDIRTLAEHFTHHYAQDLAGRPVTLAESAIELLIQHDWPGNVRELENAIRRALVLTSAQILSPTDFEFVTNEVRGNSGPQDLSTFIRDRVQQELAEDRSGSVHKNLMEEIERPLIQSVVNYTDGNQIRAASILGINRNTLRKKISDLQIELPRRRTIA